MNLKPVKLTYYIAFCLAFLLVSCNQTKHVPEGKYLLKKNKLVVKGDNMDEEMIHEIIRQQPNRKTLGVKMKLWAYNRETYFYLIKSDTLTIAKKRARLNNKLREKNKRKALREKRINERRIQKARERGDSVYFQKFIPRKDTIAPRRFFREWFKYKIGEPPVIFDTSLFSKSKQQIRIYMVKKGYYFSNVSGDLDTNSKNNKITANYFIETGSPYIIDSVTVKGENASVLGSYYSFTRESGSPQLKGERLDSDMLADYKNKVARYMRDEGFYGFSPSQIFVSADSASVKDMKVKLTIEFGDRVIKDKDTTYKVKHQLTYVRDVYFHLADTIYVLKDVSFAQQAKARGESVMENNFLNTLDSLEYREIYMTKKEKLKNNPPIDLSVDTLQRLRMATFKYNVKPVVRPSIIELQNYLEESNLYKEYYLERSYSSLLQLDVFQTIKPELIEIPGTNLIDVHYYLVAADKQIYSFEPRFTNSNGFLGVAASLNYNNKNLFRGSEKLTISFSGGFESTPPVFDKTVDGEKIKNAGRSFNTFEFGPSLKFDLPGLFPFPVTKLSKRKLPRTILSTAYNYQDRIDFDRGVFQFNYMYKFRLNKTQVMQFGFPFASAIKFVAITKNQDFEDKLNQSNDLFLRNAYSDQFIWQDFKVIFEYTDKNLGKKKNTTVFYNITLDHAGLFTSWVSNKVNPVTFQKQIFGVPYSQFARVDNTVIVGYPITKNRSVHFRGMIGGGLPYGNSTTSLPYDYSFFAGGANDNRGWRARALGPGSYAYYLFPDRTATQIGDIRFGGSAEYRFSMSKLFKGAVFTDAGNIWTVQNDPKRPGGQISNNWYKEIALSAGVGLRLDFSFFVVRLDLGMPITNPGLPEGSRWIFQSRQPFYDKAFEKFGANYKSMVPRPFIPVLNFGIGYPF